MNNTPLDTIGANEWYTRIFEVDLIDLPSVSTAQNGITEIIEHNIAIRMMTLMP